MGETVCRENRQFCNNLNYYLTCVVERLGTDYKKRVQLQKRNEMNTVCLLGGSFFLPEAFAKKVICADIDLLFGGILYFFTSQVPRGFCVALILVMADSLSLIRYNGGEKEFLWLLQGKSTMFRS